MSTLLSVPHMGVFHPQFIKDTAGNRLVVLPQDEFEVLLEEKMKAQSLADILAKESKAVQASSIEILREFEAIEI
ncbi:MAG: hypothetical protein LBF69_03555 [Prevotellaceae bacterium]|jgi:hypothetical protein|nr:hypothetical protein [Prevotellaceae bacterium]